jgi:hypothetical protein
MMNYYYFQGDIPREHRSKVDSMFTLIVAEESLVKGNLTKVGRNTYN